MDDDFEIDCHQARELIEQGSVILVDIRDSESYEKSHIPGAIQVSNENIQKFLIDADKQRPVICYCYHGISSQSAAGYLMRQGFEKVYSLRGGYEHWRQFDAAHQSEN